MNRRAVAFLAVHIAAGFVFLSPAYLRPDSGGVYSYLRSMTFDRDLLLFDEWAEMGMVRDGITYFKEVTRTGALANHWGIGTSAVVAPPYVLWHLVRRGADNGFGAVSGALLAWCTVILGALASLLGDLAIRRVVPDISLKLRILAIAFVWIGTPIFWYQYRLPLGSHVAGAFAVGLLCAILSNDRASASRSFAIGIAFGLAVATRIQHVVLAPALLYFFVATRERRSSFALAAGGALIPVAFQGLTWQILYGTPLGPLTQGSNLQQSTWAAFDRVALLPVLVSAYHGLFAWSPIALLAIAGWLVAIRRGNRVWGWTLLLMFAAQWIANGAFDRYFWAGLSFGARRFVDLAVPFAIGFGMLLASHRRVAIVGGAISVAWSVAIAIAVFAGRVGLAEDLTWDELARGVFDWSDLEAGTLRSPIVDPLLLRQSLVALACIAAFLIVLAFAMLRPRVLRWLGVTYAAIVLIALLAAWPATRRHAARELDAYRIDRARASRLGPLLDQQRLLEKERDYYRKRGQIARATETSEEIESIERLVTALDRK